jgi:hypothetical protein
MKNMKGTTMRIRSAFSVAAILAAGLLAGCNGSGSPTYISIPPSGATGLAATPSNLTYTTTGAQQQFTASESGYSGTLTAASTNCSGVATFTPSSGTGPSLTVTVTSVAAGSCQINVTDSNSHATTVSVGITTTSGTVH